MNPDKENTDISDTVKKGRLAKDVKVKWVYPENLTSHLVSNLVVQSQPDIFILSFFEVWPPLVLGKTEEELQKELSAIDSIEANCVARLALTPARMKEFVNLMSENLKRFEEEQER